jgi:anaphase-promoting complex subunit 1
MPSLFLYKKLTMNGYFQVMAGTGNLDVLRIARQLRKRHSADVSYGSHLAIHMAIGLLYLGGGRYMQQ